MGAWFEERAAQKDIATPAMNETNTAKKKYKPCIYGIYTAYQPGVWLTGST